MNFNAAIETYMGNRQADERYASFDYCFNYFQSFREEQNTTALASNQHLASSCIYLGFYLASWGMYRGSADLLQKSARQLAPFIRLIANADAILWEIDAHCYTEENTQHLLKMRSALYQAYPSMTDILASKIMLGVFGNVPAFDTNFKKGFQVSTFGKKALEKIAKFYTANQQDIEKHEIYTLNFVNATKTQRRYTRAKIIDMAFFIHGESKSRGKQKKMEYDVRKI